ncbi:MAG: hypothetical protein INR67_08865, partial [Jatrophihabitans endophyticus]
MTEPPATDATPEVDALVLGPATRLLWRTHDTVHLELGGRAVIVPSLPREVIEGMAASPVAHQAPLGRQVAPRHPRAAPPAAAEALDPDTREALADLVSDGFLWRRAPGSGTGGGTRPAAAAGDPRLRPPVPRLAGELAALSERHGERAAAILAARS